VQPERARCIGSLVRGRARAGWRVTAVSTRAWHMGNSILAAGASGARPLRRPRPCDAAAASARAAVAASYGADKDPRLPS
jgi:hypothetical protein